MRTRQLPGAAVALALLLGVAPVSGGSETSPAFTSNQPDLLAGELASALADPVSYVQNRNHLRLPGLLDRGGPVTGLHLPSIDTLLAQAAVQENTDLLFLASVARYAAGRGTADSAGCAALLSAAEVAWLDFDNPDLALTLLKSGGAHACATVAPMIADISSYVVNDREIARLLATPWYDMEQGPRAAYALELEDALRRFPQSSLRTRAMTVLGDLNYSMGRWRAVRRWYRRAVAADSSLRNETPAGFRIDDAGRRIAGQNIALAAYLVYAAALAALLLQLYRARWRFDFGAFGGKLAVMVPLFAIVCVSVILFDRSFARREVMDIAGSARYQHLFVKPLVPLSMAGSTLLLLACTVAGLLPIVYGAALSSVPSRHTRPIAAVVALLLWAALWVQLGRAHAFDATMNATAVFTKQRVHVNGELEELLGNGRTARRLSRFLAGSENEDLRLFLHERHPAIEKSLWSDSLSAHP